MFVQKFARGSRCLLFSAFLLSALPGLASVHDRLNALSIEIPKPEQELLLDITQAGERLVAVGAQGVIIFSDDQGNNWTQAQVPTSVLLTAVHFIDAQKGWAVGHDGIVLATQDAGQSWQRVLSAKQLNQKRVLQLEVYIATLQEQGAMDPVQLENLEYSLDDARVAVEDNAMQPLLDVWFSDAQQGYLLGAYGALYQTRDGGESWHSLAHLVPNPDGLHLNKMLQSQQGELFIVGEAGLLVSSTDQGASWQPVASPYDGSFFALIEHDKLYLMGLRGNIYSSQNGLHWQPESLPKRATLNAAVSNGQELFLLGQGGLLLRKQGDDFVQYNADLKRTLVAGILSDNTLITVGAGGINKVALVQQEAH